MNMQKVGDILLKVGGAVVSTVVPGGAAIVELVNSFLPDDKKLPASATGDQINSAISKLPPEQQTSIMLKELDVEMADINAWAGIVASLAAADGPGSSTRPEIAKMMAYAVSGAVGFFMVSWSWAIITGAEKTLQQLAGSWQIMIAVLGTPTVLLRSYFGMRSEEKQARYITASGGQVPSKNGVADLIRSFTGK